MEPSHVLIWVKPSQAPKTDCLAAKDTHLDSAWWILVGAVPPHCGPFSVLSSQLAIWLLVQVCWLASCSPLGSAQWRKPFMSPRRPAGQATHV